MPRLTPKQYNQILAKSNPAIKAQLAAEGETGQYDYARDLRIIIERHAPDLMRGIAFEYRFCEFKKWSMDAVWFPEKVFVEVNGGRYKHGGGRHGGGADYQKLRRAAMLGYRYVPLEPTDIDERSWRETLTTIREILGR
jgi:hypothetical protein